MQFTLTASHVQHHAAALLRSELRLKDFGNRCPVTTLLAVIFTACCRLGSLFAAARRLAAAPSHETVRQALLHNLPDLDTLERRLNRVLVADLPKGLTRRRQRLAIDLTLLPYHGQAATDPHELVRGQAKSGTTHFHAYATAYRGPARPAFHRGDDLCAAGREGGEGAATPVATLCASGRAAETSAVGPRLLERGAGGDVQPQPVGAFVPGGGGVGAAQRVGGVAPRGVVHAPPRAAPLPPRAAAFQRSAVDAVACGRTRPKRLRRTIYRKTDPN